MNREPYEFLLCTWTILTMNLNTNDATKPWTPKQRITILTISDHIKDASRADHRAQQRCHCSSFLLIRRCAAGRRWRSWWVVSRWCVFLFWTSQIWQLKEYFSQINIQLMGTAFYFKHDQLNAAYLTLSAGGRSGHMQLEICGDNNLWLVIPFIPTGKICFFSSKKVCPKTWWYLLTQIYSHYW